MKIISMMDADIGNLKALTAELTRLNLLTGYFPLENLKFQL